MVVLFTLVSCATRKRAGSALYLPKTQAYPSGHSRQELADDTSCSPDKPARDGDSLALNIRKDVAGSSERVPDSVVRLNKSPDVNLNLQLVLQLISPVDSFVIKSIELGHFNTSNSLMTYASSGVPQRTDTAMLREPSLPSRVKPGGGRAMELYRELLLLHELEKLSGELEEVKRLLHSAQSTSAGHKDTLVIIREELNQPDLSSDSLKLHPADTLVLPPVFSDSITRMQQ